MKPSRYEEALEHANGVLSAVAATLGLELPRVRLGLNDPEQVAQVLARAGAAAGAVAAERPELTRAAEVARMELASACLELTSWTSLRGREAPRRLRHCLGRLREASVDELVAAIPTEASDLGYDRVLLSRVDHGQWIPCSAFSRDDPTEARAIVTAGNTPSCRSTRGLLEEQVVRTRTTILVRDARGNPRVHAQLIAVTNSHTYVAAPVVVRNRVVGLVHVDRNHETGTMDDFDRDLLELLADGLSLTLERAEALADLDTLRGSVDAYAGALQDLVGQLGERHEARPAHGFAPPYGARAYVGPTAGLLGTAPRPAPLAGRAVPDEGQDDGHPWRDELTRREEQVLRLVAQGLTNAQIGERLFVAEGTVKSHVKSLMRKLDVATRAEAGAAYHRQMHRLSPARPH